MVVQIENQTLHFRERARSKCGTFDYLDYRPGGGDKKVGFLLAVIAVMFFLIEFKVFCEVSQFVEIGL